MRSLQGRIVLITGASSGFGRATAFAFAAEGARLLLCARRLELLQEMDAPLLEAGVSILGACCGSSPDHIRAFRAAMDEYLSEHGGGRENQAV